MRSLAHDAVAASFLGLDRLASPPRPPGCSVTPAQAGVQTCAQAAHLGSGFRRNDGCGLTRRRSGVRRWECREATWPSRACARSCRGIRSRLLRACGGQGGQVPLPSSAPSRGTPSKARGTPPVTPFANIVPAFSWEPPCGATPRVGSERAASLDRDLAGCRSRIGPAGICPPRRLLARRPISGW